MWEGCKKGKERLSGGCGEAVLRVWGGCWWVCENCLQHVGRLSGGYGRLYDGCGEAISREW